MFGAIFYRFFMLLTIIMLIITPLAECVAGDKVLNSLPECESQETYHDKDGFREYTDYAKYYYDDVTADDLEDNKYFHKVTEADIADIQSYYYDFSGFWYGEMNNKYHGYSGKFDFKIEQIEAGDYFYIKSLEGQTVDEIHYEKFDNYTVYYFDVESQTLYYLHNNI